MKTNLFPETNRNIFLRKKMDKNKDKMHTASNRM